MPRTDPDRESRLAALAGVQHGLVTAAQARDSGFGLRAVSARLHDGRWRLVLPGVMQVGAHALPDVGRVQAAVLYVPGSAAAGEAAVFLHDLGGSVPALGEVEVLTARPTRSAPAVRLRTTTDLVDGDITKRKGLAVTSVVRTIIDAFARDVMRGEAILDLSLQRRKTTLDRVRERATHLRRRGRPGVGYLLDALAERDELTALTRGHWEPRVLRLLGHAGIPGPAVNHPVSVFGRRYVLDFAWPAPRVFLEFDGWAHHSSRDAFETDRRRQNDLAAAGWIPIRVTERSVTTLDVRAFERLRAVLEQRGTSTGPVLDDVPRLPGRTRRGMWA